VDHEWCHEIATAGHHRRTRLERRAHPVLVSESLPRELIEASGDRRQRLERLPGRPQHGVHPERSEIVHHHGDHG
jgi:hypothetical protein